MKGLVFVEFMDMVEEKFSPKILQTIIDKANLPSGCAYTSLGTYDHDEMVQLVTCLGTETKIPIPDLLKAFGETMFNKLTKSHAQFMVAADTFGFVELIDRYVHIEVRKLYPDAELPSFECARPNANELTLHYKSVRPMADFAHGMLVGCIAHFGEAISMERQDSDGAAGTAATFVMRKI
jgi:hypothetical protein